MAMSTEISVEDQHEHTHLWRDNTSTGISVEGEHEHRDISVEGQRMHVHLCGEVLKTCLMCFVSVTAHVLGAHRVGGRVLQLLTSHLCVWGLYSSFLGCG
jgi:hypothetical protein